MAENQPRTSGRKAVRYGIPAGIAGIAAVTVGLIPALAQTGAPDLPKISAEELVAKMAGSETRHMSGTVKVTTDLGLPEVPGAGGGNGGQGGGLFGGGQRGGEDGEGDRKGRGPSPQEKLMQLASGEHTLRVAADGPEKQRVSIVEDASEYSFIRNGGEVWTYDSGSDTAFHAEAPEGAEKRGEKQRERGRAHGGLGDVTPQKAAEQALKAVDDSTSVTVDGTAQVAGRDAYQLLIEPKGAPHSTVDSVRIAVDADNGVPLKFTLAPKGGGEPIVEAGYTKVDFGEPDAGTFDFKPPKGTDVTEIGPNGPASGGRHGEPGRAGGHGKPDGGHGKPDAVRKSEKLEKFGAGFPGFAGMNTIGEGWGAVAELDAGEGAASGLPGAPSGRGEDGEAREAEGFFDSFSEKAKGDFGTGRVFSTRLVNALMTDDGKVYVGAVTKEGLIKAADAAAK